MTRPSSPRKLLPILLAGLAAVGCALSSGSSETDGPDEHIASTASALTASDVMARGFDWVNAGCMDYCESPNYGSSHCGYTCVRGGACDNPTWNPYRSDCRGFVSWAWGLPAPGLVVHQFWPIVHQIGVNELQPGDALIENGNAHIMLFNGWANASTIQVLHEGQCGEVAALRNFAVHNIGAQTVTVSWTSNPFWAVRWNDLQTCCTDGDTQTEACTGCGSHSRTCASCAWSDWGTCKGPPEVCDGVDNDCNGLVDDGHPQTFGATLPDYAATLVDVSYPQALDAGELGFAWAEFRNVGAKPWSKDGLWLAARGAADGGASAFFDPEHWRAWNVASVLDADVEPGAIARFTFSMQAPASAGGPITETFQLEVPGGNFIACPTADISPSIVVLPAGEGAHDTHDTHDATSSATGTGGALAGVGSTSAPACSYGRASTAPVRGFALTAALLGLARRPRRASRSRARMRRGS